ncbi:C1 family peptidase [Paenibacillus frigoriresistens]|uniref:C1 family peptidase n=1 Tax=Paenibacillus alginolyticus TaxID=59839 RepID=UPI001563BBF8|nr:C1 family peptidase [Paenibacillus frigoriresistens]NRF91514.1 C1 family peptidase [Paenibacillus frigoriresistens]
MMKRQYLLKADKADSRDFLFTHKGIALPVEVDLRPHDAAAIFDQGYLGSCTANAICALQSFLDKKNSAIGAFFNYSRLFLYWQERNIEGTIDYDSGAYIRDGMKVLQQIGCAGESTFPYVEETFRNTPSKAAYDTAQYHKISSYQRLNNNTPAQLKESLASGYPVVMGVEIYQSFESEAVAKNGIVPFPDREKEYSLGGHAVLAMGYKWIDGTEYIICRNSWGPDWGDKGYFYLPMKFIGYFVSDLWTAR